MGSRLLWPVVLSALLTGASTAAAQSPPLTVGYAGFLLEDDALVDASYDIVVALFSTADPEGSDPPVWGELHRNVAVVGGAFSLSLGSAEPLTLEMLAAGPLWLQITIDGEVTRPRLPFEALPYARVAEATRTSENAGGVEVGGQAVIDRSGAWTGPGQVIEALDCADGQIPVQGAGGWGCGTFEVDDATFGLADQSCPEGWLLAGFDEAGVAVCADFSQAVSPELLEDGGYLTQAEVAEGGYYSPANRPDWSVVTDVPAVWQDGDQDTTLGASAPLQVSGTSVRLNTSGCNAGQVLRWNGSSFQCQNPPALQCEDRSAGFTTAPVTVDCQSGWVLMGGGIVVTNNNGGIFDTVESRPSGNAWRCENTDVPTAWEGSSTCYARCCRLN